MLKPFFYSLLPLFCCGAATLHVNGSARSGGNGTSERPFRTIQQAADRVSPGDTVIIAPGVYFETVRLRRFGRANAPILFRADKIQKNRVIITGADPEVRRGRRKWRLYDRRTGTYVLDCSHHPARILYSGTDLFGYRSLEALMKFEARPGIPGPNPTAFFRCLAYVPPPMTYGLRSIDSALLAMAVSLSMTGSDLSTYIGFDPSVLVIVNPCSLIVSPIEESIFSGSAVIVYLMFTFWRNSPSFSEEYPPTCVSFPETSSSYGTPIPAP